ncbi:MAG: hotdog fold thioesterase [Deltaproteobacteria bacterium]|nr:hotdog fold thioesterase [Deltaproteobacteria bacterium]
MVLWKTQTTLDHLKERSRNTLVEHLGIEFLEIGDDYLKARMPVDNRTKQPTGLLHGGASVVLAETLGSVAARLCVDSGKKGIVGLEINANHIRPVHDGWVTGITKPIHVGSATQVWEIRIYNEEDKLVCASRLTVANIDN